LKRKSISSGTKKKDSEEKYKSPWSLHMRSFWKITFINPPEEQGKLLLLQNDEITMAED
jgi:hypothetical protein